MTKFFVLFSRIGFVGSVFFCGLIDVEFRGLCLFWTGSLFGWTNRRTIAGRSWLVTFFCSCSVRFESVCTSIWSKGSQVVLFGLEMGLSLCPFPSFPTYFCETLFLNDLF